jgi:type IV pilus assembly protein PilY1
VDLGDTDKSNWVISQVAALSGGTQSTDRRFFNRISVARTRHFNEAFDSVALGSGNRANPMSTDVDDRFYMIQDTRIGLITPTSPIPSDCASVPTGVPQHYPNCATPIDNGDLYDVTTNLIQDGADDAAKRTALEDLFDKAGWRMDLQGGDYSGGTGEKSLSPALTLDGVIWFTTFEPLPADAGLCVPRGGTGYLYAVDLQDASAVFDFTFNNVISKPDRRVTLFVPSIPDTPAVHFGEDNIIRLLFPSGGGPIPTQIGNPTDSGAKRITPKTGGINWYEHEEQ